MKYCNILFDADGTLFDFKLAEYTALSETLSNFGLPDTPDIHQKYSAANAEHWALLEKKLVKRDELRINRFGNFCERAGFSEDPQKMTDFYENALSHKGFLIKGAIDICKTLSEHCDLYIITNGFRHIQTGRFSASPLLPFFKQVFISQDIGVEKPDPRFFAFVEDHIPSFQKQTALVVGDSLSSDIAGGLQYGLDSCWFNPSGVMPPENMKIHYTISSLSELQQIIL